MIQKLKSRDYVLDLLFVYLGIFQDKTLKT